MAESRSSMAMPLAAAGVEALPRPRRSAPADDERDACPSGGQGQRVGAHLVGHVAVGGDPVGPDDDSVHEAPGDEAGAGAVDDDPVGDAHLGQLERGQAGALEKGGVYRRTPR